MRRYKLHRSAAAVLPRLLHMEYTPRQLAEELGVSKRQIMAACEGGAPYRQTDAGRIYIVGDEFAAWYRAIVRERKRPMRHDEAFCLACRRPVPLPEDAQVQPLPNGAERIIGRCPVCGARVNRFREAAS